MSAAVLTGELGTAGSSTVGAIGKAGKLDERPDSELLSPDKTGNPSPSPRVISSRSCVGGMTFFAGTTGSLPPLLRLALEEI